MKNFILGLIVGAILIAGLTFFCPHWKKDITLTPDEVQKIVEEEKVDCPDKKRRKFLPHKRREK